MRIMKKEKVDVKKFMEEIKANRTNRSFTSIERRDKSDNRSEINRGVGGLYSGMNNQEDRSKSPPPQTFSKDRPNMFHQNYAPQSIYPAHYQYQNNSSQFCQPSQGFMSTPLIYNSHPMMNFSQNFQQNSQMHYNPIPNN